MLFTTPGATDHISGVILYDETIRQKTKEGVPFPSYLAQHRMIPGIKVDLGAKPLAGFPGETITEGLDGLRERMAEYYKLGARFAKWRAVIDIGSGIPTSYAIDTNAEALARYATICQEASIVPIVEPEVLMDGGHTLERCEEVTNVVLERVFSHLFAARVVPGGHGAQAQHGHFRKEMPDPGLSGTSGRGDVAHLEAPSAHGRTRHRFPVRRPEFDRGDAASELDERRRAVALGADLQLRTRAAGRRVERLGRQGRLVRGGPASFLHSCETKRTRRRPGSYKSSMEKSAA